MWLDFTNQGAFVSAWDSSASLKIVYVGGSPGLVVMGGDSYSKGREFESRHCILSGHFLKYLFVVKFVMCVWEDEHKNGKEAEVGLFKKCLAFAGNISVWIIGVIFFRANASARRRRRASSLATWIRIGTSPSSSSSTRWTWRGSSSTWRSVWTG